MKPMPLKVLAKMLGLSHDNPTLVQGIAIDSRKVEPGDLFFALPGQKVDGHTFLQDVAAKGASGAVIREDYRGETFGLPVLHVPNVVDTLQDLARKSLEKRSSKVIAISGSLGKTTTKEFLATLLRTSYKIFASPLSYNSQVTVPLSIMMADETEDYLVLEMGMSEPGEIEKLISVAPPDLAVVTTVAVQHASSFADGLTGISREKAALFSHPQTELGLLNHDIHHFEEVAKTGTCPKKTFSISNPEADYFLEVIEDGVRVHMKGEPPFDISMNLPMKEHYQNFLAAAAVAHTLDVPWTVIREAAGSLKLPAMRFEKVDKQGILFINDAYNANPDSMKAALESLPKPSEGGKTIAVLGEMDALGMYTEGGHALVAEAALQYSDMLLCLGPRCETMRKIWKREKKPVELFETRAELEKALKLRARPGDVVLLKGARVHALDQILKRF